MPTEDPVLFPRPRRRPLVVRLLRRRGLPLPAPVRVALVIGAIVLAAVHVASPDGGAADPAEPADSGHVDPAQVDPGVRLPPRFRPRRRIG